MIGKLTVDYFEEGKLKREVFENLNILEASRQMARAIKKHPQAQLTWIRKED